MIAATKNLLAVIHGDGGHHTEAVGLSQSIADAQAVVVGLMVKSDELAAAQQREAGLRAAVQSLMEAMPDAELDSEEYAGYKAHAKGVAALAASEPPIVNEFIPLDDAEELAADIDREISASEPPQTPAPAECAHPNYHDSYGCPSCGYKAKGPAKTNGPA